VSALLESSVDASFDDTRTVAGQATVVAEIVEQLGQAPDTIVVPVGGGGLLAGTATWLQAIHPRTRVVGVEYQVVTHSM
jgi:threonine dehydratase